MSVPRNGDVSETNYVGARRRAMKANSRHIPGKIVLPIEYTFGVGSGVENSERSRSENKKSFVLRELLLVSGRLGEAERSLTSF